MTDAEGQARLQRQQAKIQARMLLVNAVAEPILQELRDHGFAIAAIMELCDEGVGAPAAAHILVKWLPQVDDYVVKEQVVRALSSSWAKGIAAGPLIREFKSLPSHTFQSSIRWVVGMALAEIATKDNFEALASLVRDPQYGSDREHLVLKVGRMRCPGADDVLLELLGETPMIPCALKGLQALRPAASKAKPKVAELIGHPDQKISNAARKTLAVLERADR